MPFISSSSPSPPPPTESPNSPSSQSSPATSSVQIAGRTGGTPLGSSPPYTNALGQFTHFVDQHLQLVRAGVVLIGVTGVFLIGRSVRLMKTFYSVSDIPEEFIRKQIKLRGKVRGHEKGHLVIEHLPIIQRRGIIQSRYCESSLPVHLAGVSLLECNAHHLATVMPLESLIWFRILAVNKEQGVECIAFKKKNWFSSVIVNEQLVREGFAKVKPVESVLTSSPEVTKLMQKLFKAELYAEKKAKGIWARPSLSERVKERTMSLQSSAKRCVQAVTTPFTAGVSAVKSLGARIGQIWNSRKSSKQR